MRKALYGMTALASLMTGSVHAAEPLKLSITGNMQEWFAIIKHEGDVGKKFNTFGINTDNEINFTAQTLLDNGMEAEAFLRLNVYDDNPGPNGAVGGVGLDEQWVALGGAFGKVYTGVKDSINKSLHNQPIDYGIGSGDVNIWVIKPAFTSSPSSNILQGARDRTSFEVIADTIPMVGYISPQLGAASSLV